MSSPRKALFGGVALTIVALTALTLLGGGHGAKRGGCGACPSATTATAEKPACGRAATVSTCQKDDAVVLNAAEETPAAAKSGCSGGGTCATQAAVVMDAAEEHAEAAKAKAHACTACKTADGMCTHCKHKHAAAKITELKTTIAAAQKAVKADDTETALAELAKAETLVATLNKWHGPKPAKATEKTSGIINQRCPMMGRSIDPANVPAKLVREFNGQHVGFCCGGCPAAWDKLSDGQKQAKLEAATD